MNQSQSLDLLKRKLFLKKLQTLKREYLFCSICVRYFFTKDDFNEHVQKHLSETNNVKDCYMRFIEKYICSSCDEQFEEKLDLIIHYNTVCFYVPYTCKHCTEICENSSSLQMHLFYHHSYSFDMLRNEGFLNVTDENPHASQPSLIKIPRSKSFKAPPAEITDKFVTKDNSTILKASSPNSKFQRVGRKHETLSFNSVNKSHTCEICTKSFTRKCALDIHLKKHVFKPAKEKKKTRHISQKTSIKTFCESFSNRNLLKERNNPGSCDVQGQNSNSLRAIFKTGNVVYGSSSSKTVQKTSKIQCGKRSASKSRLSRNKILNIVKEKQQHRSNNKIISRIEDASFSALKKITLSTKKPNAVLSATHNVSENAKRDTKLRSKVNNLAVLDIGTPN